MFKPYTNKDFEMFVDKKGGIKKVKVKDLENIVELHGADVLNLMHFNNVYQYVSEKKATNTMNYLTWAIAGMTLE
ncbi:hypothetical protein P4654_02090 [Niallia taxi]|uniref:hypothetical protein n=1 Tax=Niallia taxi TaxID=2499688 RepID=UPI002E2491CE|nr:hypothetical protein [Niallia taxi]MED4118090.1 hypothetical protein [Niallia taxi]